MMNELKELLNKGGEKVFTRYAVEIGDALWTALYDYCVAKECTIESVYEDEANKTFAVIKDTDGKFYRLNFSVVDEAVEIADELEDLTGFEPEDEPQFDAEAVAEYAKSKEKKDDDEEKCPKCGKPKSECECEDKEDGDEGNEGEEEKCPDCGKPKSKCTCKKEDKKSKYVLEEIQEYVELSEKYSALEAEHNTTLETVTSLQAQVEELTQFKATVERAEKQKMIDGFYMLSDEDKKDVVENIDTYSLDDIEAKLSIICVRNKVSFSLEDDNKTETTTTFNLNDGMSDTAPAWVKALRSVAKDM